MLCEPSNFRRLTPSTRCCRNVNSPVDIDGDGAPRHVKHAHKAKKPDALVLAFQQALTEEPGAGRVPPAAGARARRRGRPEPPPREDAHGAQEDQVLRQRAGHQGRLDQKTARRPQALNPEPPTSSTKAKNKN